MERSAAATQQLQTADDEGMRQNDAATSRTDDCQRASKVDQPPPRTWSILHAGLHPEVGNPPRTPPLRHRWRAIGRQLVEVDVNPAVDQTSILMSRDCFIRSIDWQPSNLPIDTL